ncbi:lipopolysaccharide biosynthesis protein [Xylanimonas sp. McL0601]|uniref:lipopolysaccharide biosynthesis protein n=1 Tax=Xylanimonas sp. McL0601 TaxID=3414739 RepID=UPI003CF74724
MVGQLSLMAVLPVLTRAFGPAALGEYQVATAIAMTLQPLATLRVEFVLPATRYSANARRLYRTGVLAILVVAAVAIAVGIVLAVVGGGSGVSVSMMSAALMAAFGLTVVDNARLIRSGQLKLLARRNLISGLLAAGLQIVTVLVGGSILFAAFSILAARLISMAMTRGRGFARERVEAGDEDTPYTIRRIIPSIVSGVTATATSQSFVITSGALGAGSAAFVGVAQRAAGAPLTLIGQGLGQVVQSRLAPVVRARRPDLARLVRRQILILGTCSLAIAAAIIVGAPILAEPLLGEGWGAAGDIAALLAIPMAFQLVVGPLMPVLPMLARERLLAKLQIWRLVGTALVLALSLGMGIGLVGATIAFGAVTVAGYVVMLVIVLAETRKYDRSCHESFMALDIAQTNIRSMELCNDGD